MKPWQRLKNSGYRFRVYLFAGLLVFLVVMSLAFTFGVSWYSKRLSALIVEKDFKARETERTLVNLLASMDGNRKKYFLLEKPEYLRMFREDSRSFRKQLSRLEELGLSEEEEPTFRELKEQFEDYLHKDPFITGEDPSAIESVSDLPLEEVRHLLWHLLDLNQERMDLRITQMSRLEQRAFQVVFLGAMIALLAAGLLSFLLIRSITRPIDLLRKGTQEIAEGKFTHRVDFATKGELGDLADSFNEMAYQLKKLDDMKVDFMALVSHELKTPLTSMKEAVGLLLEEGVTATLGSTLRKIYSANNGGYGAFFRNNNDQTYADPGAKRINIGVSGEFITDFVLNRSGEVSPLGNALGGLCLLNSSRMQFDQVIAGPSQGNGLEVMGALSHSIEIQRLRIG